MAWEESANVGSKQSPDKKHLTISTILTPLAWFGALTGIFPYSRMSVEPDPVALQKTSKDLSTFLDVIHVVDNINH